MANSTVPVHYRLLQSRLKQAQGLGFTGPSVEWTDDDLENQRLAEQYDTSELDAFMQGSGGISADMGQIYNEIQKYKDNPYVYEQLMNMYNSYKAQKFSPTSLQDIGEFFGDTSARTNFENQRVAGMRSEMQKILESMHTEDVTDPVLQAEKQRQAGLNPDLTGGISSQTPGSIDQAEQAPALVNEGQSSISDVVNQVMSVVNYGFSFAQAIQGIQANDLALGIQQMDFYHKSQDLFMTILENGLSEHDMRVLLDPMATDEKGERLYDDDVVNSVYMHYNGLIMDAINNDNRFSPSFRRKFKRSFKVSGVYQNSNMYKALQSLYHNKKGFVEVAGDPRFSQSLEKCLTMFGERMQRCYLDIQDLQTQYEHDRLSVTGENGESLGTLAGQAESAGFESDKYQREYDKIINKMWDDIMKDLESEDDFLSKFFRFLIPIVRTNMMNFSPRISHTSGNSPSTSIGF